MPIRSPSPAASPKTPLSSLPLSLSPLKSAAVGTPSRRAMLNGETVKMYVVNRRGEQEMVSFDRILQRLQELSYNLHWLVDPARVAQAVINGMYCGIETSELDELAAQTCAYMAATHPDFSKLAARIAISNLHKNTLGDFSKVAAALYNFTDPYGRPAPLLNDKVYNFIKENQTELNDAIDYSRDFEYDYFGFKTLERSYLLRIDDRIAERPQHLIMRVACAIHCGNVQNAIETYHLISQKYFIHATPTLFNAGLPLPQMSSCFLMRMKADSIEGIYETLKNCAMISKTAGGIGLAVHCIRATNSYIRGTNGHSNGLVPMLRVFNDTARYVDQGGGKRKGSIAVYLEPWHADIFSFLDLRKNHGKEEQRARDLFLGLWIPDLFMKRVESGGNWTLMCPNECPGLPEVYGAKFEELYEKYERAGRGRKTIPAQTLWFAILQSQIETGTPYMVYKDACNEKSNQKNLGTIQGSNLCTEIVEYTSEDEIAVCNLASLALPNYVDTKNRAFNFQKLYEVVKVVTRNLNRVIDQNYYPVPETKKSNLRHRPIGIGVQGLADAFMLLRFPYESTEARELNKDIFETIYFGACEASCELAVIDGPYETFAGSPASEGKLQFDLWGAKPHSNRWNWAALKEKIVKYGMRNSLLVAPMPTASTSQILGNNEAFEPYTSNIYCRRVLSGEFFVINPHLLNDLLELDLWDDDLKQKLIAHNGSVQRIPEIPDDLKALYKTVWEIRQKCIVDMAIDRAIYIDQSHSLNIHMKDPTFAKLTAMHFHGWKNGLKTGTYYLRTQAAVDAIKFTVDTSTLRNAQDTSSSAIFATAKSGGGKLEIVTPKKRSYITAISGEDIENRAPVATAANRVSPNTEKAVSGNNNNLSSAGGSGGAEIVCPLRKKKSGTTAADEEEECIMCSS